MRQLTAALLAATLSMAALPEAAQDFSLYRGSEASLALSTVRASPFGGGSFETLALDTRHTLGIAPFLGAQVDLGLAALDWDDTAVTGGLHLHLVRGGGASRFGVFWLPAWDTGSGDRLDAYGLEGIFEAVPGATVELRGGRFDGDGPEGPFFGATGHYALGGQVAVVPSFQYGRLEDGGTRVNATEAVLGAEYHLPGTDVRLSAGIGFARFSGDVDTETALKLQVGATVFAFGQPNTPARMRTFGRQGFAGAF